jgi:hypothetical protein
VLSLDNSAEQPDVIEKVKSYRAIEILRVVFPDKFDGM